MPYQHLDLFPEEYDFMMDSEEEAKIRRCGVNPLNQEYIDETNERRYARGVKVFMPTSSSPRHHIITLSDDSFITSREYCGM
jgi:hypothetical protein